MSRSQPHHRSPKRLKIDTRKIYKKIAWQTFDVYANLAKRKKARETKAIHFLNSGRDNFKKPNLLCREEHKMSVDSRL